MLMSVAVLAFVGGILAFKASRLTNNYCIRTGSPGICTTYVVASVDAMSGGLLAYTAITTDTHNCTRSTAPNCMFSTHLVNN